MSPCGSCQAAWQTIPPIGRQTLSVNTTRDTRHVCGHEVLGLQSDAQGRRGVAEEIPSAASRTDAVLSKCCAGLPQHGNWPECEVTADDGTKTAWTREAEKALLAKVKAAGFSKPGHTFSAADRRQR